MNALDEFLKRTEYTTTQGPAIAALAVFVLFLIIMAIACSA